MTNNFFLKLSIIVFLFIHSASVHSQKLSEAETIQYIQNTFNKYKIDFLSNKNYFGKDSNTIIKYSDPIITIEFNKSIFSFNVNDITFETKEKKTMLGWELAFISENANIKDEDTFTSKLISFLSEEIATTRLKNAFIHLQNISSKEPSSPDPFDNPIAHNRNKNPYSTKNSSSQSSKQYFPEAGFSVQVPCKLYKNEVYLQQLKSFGLISNNEQAYVCAYGYETNPETAIIYNINVIPLSDTYNGNIESLKLKKEYIQKFGLNEFNVSTFKGMKVLERNFSMENIPHKAIALTNNGKFYLLMVGSSTNVNNNFTNFTNSFSFIK